MGFKEVILDKNNNEIAVKPLKTGAERTTGISLEKDETAYGYPGFSSVRLRLHSVVVSGGFLQVWKFSIPSLDSKATTMFADHMDMNGIPLMKTPGDFIFGHRRKIVSRE